MHSDGDGWGWSGTAEEPASCYCRLIGPQAPSVRNNASLHGQVAAARRLPPPGGRQRRAHQSALFFKWNTSNAAASPQPPSSAHESATQFSLAVSLLPSLTSKPREIWCYVWGASDSPHSFLQTGPKSGMCLSVLHGSQLGGWINASNTKRKNNNKKNALWEL